MSTIVATFATVPAMQPSPFDNPQVWDSVKVADVVWGATAIPGAGRIVVRRAKRSYKWDKKNPAGQVGQNQTYRGRQFPPFDLQFHFWDTLGYNAWQDYSQLFIYADGTEPPALSIYHPSLVLVGISSVIILEVGAPELQNEGGEYLATVTVEEFKPITEKNVTSSPTATNASAATTIHGSPLTSQQVAANIALAEEQHVAGDNAIFDPLLGWIPSGGGYP